MTLPTLAGGLSWDTSALYTTGVIKVLGGGGPANLTWNNAGGTGDGVIFDTAGQQNWNNGAAPAQFNTADNITFNDSNNSHYAVTIGANVSPGSITVSNSTGNYAFSGGSTITSPRTRSCSSGSSTTRPSPRATAGGASASTRTTG